MLTLVFNTRQQKHISSYSERCSKTKPTTLRGPVARHWPQECQGSGLTYTTSQWNPEIRFHKQCINMIWTSNTRTATWQEHEVLGFAALLCYPGFICLKQKRNGSITVCWGCRAFSWEHMTTDDSWVWAFLLDPGTFRSWLYPDPHCRGVLEQCPFKKCLFRIFLGYFTDRQKMCYTKGVPYKGFLSLSMMKQCFWSKQESCRKLGNSLREILPVFPPWPKWNLECSSPQLILRSQDSISSGCVNYQGSPFTAWGTRLWGAAVVEQNEGIKGF